MKIKINQLDEEVNEKNVKIQQLKTEVDQLHHQLVNRHQESTSVNKISVECQTIEMSISYVTSIKVYHVNSTTFKVDGQIIHSKSLYSI